MDTTKLTHKAIAFWLACLFMLAHAPTSIYAQTTVSTKNGISLASALTQEQRDTCTMLAIVGSLNSADIKVLRQMACRRLVLLDLSKARIVTSKEPYMVLDAQDEYMVCAAYADQVQEFNNGMFLNPVMRIMKYGPAYVLNYQSDEKFTVVHSAAIRQMDNNIQPEPGAKYARSTYPQMLASKDEFVFRKGVSDEDWEKLRRARITKFAGHELKKEGERYRLYCCTKKGVFSGDFFYKCPSIKTVILPHDKALDKSVVECDSPTRYIHKGK